ncbi:MAG: protein kinase [Deltaproteobacteria bacterium]|nr:protein kinase [Deltaproteobacteria bacterium]
MADSPEIAALLRDGKHAEAARILRERGERARAMDLYAQVWAWDEAADVALELGDPVTAFRFALDGKLMDRVTALRAFLRQGDPSHAAHASVLCESRKMYAAAAELSEAAGDLESAARQHRGAMDLVSSARCLEALGRYRDAGRAYEERLRDEPGDTQAALQLGRILLRFGRYDVASRHLQAAARDPGLAAPALRALVVALAAMGLGEAARSSLGELRRVDPTAPADVGALLDESGPAKPSEADETRWLAGRYKVEKVLGGGSVGRVYLARDGFYDRDVAIKVFSASSSGPDGRDAYARFVREARVSASLSHPHIVAVYEFNAASAFLVMEHMVGGTLEARLEMQARPHLGQVRGIVLGVLAALEAAHARGVVHRDVKPANVFFDAAGTVKLGDFGTAHLLDLGATQTGAFLGTLAYMSPEQITGAGVDASTDLYALGVVLHRMLAGELPFSGPDLVSQHLSEVPRPLSGLRPALGTSYDECLARCLAKAPADRFRSAVEMAAALEALPWTEPVGESAVRGPGPPETAEPAVDSSPHGPRFEPLHDRGGGAVELRDLLLGRVVLQLAAPPERLALLARFGRIASGRVQAVLRMDRTAGTALLELPGEPASADALVHPDVARGLGEIHAAGLVHGNVSEAQVRVDEAGAVVLIDGATGEGSPEDDLARLVRPRR